MQERFWRFEPKVVRNHRMDMNVQQFTMWSVRDDGVKFFVTSLVSEYALQSARQPVDLMGEVMKQLWYELHTFLNPACICSNNKTDACPVRHPRGDNDAKI